MSVTRVTILPAGVDPAKVRQKIRQEVAELAIAQRVAAELAEVADEKRRETCSNESHVRALLNYLGVSDEGGPFNCEKALRLLDEMEAAGEH